MIDYEKLKSCVDLYRGDEAGRVLLQALATFIVRGKKTLIICHTAKQTNDLKRLAISAGIEDCCYFGSKTRPNSLCGYSHDTTIVEELPPWITPNLHI